MEGRKEFFAKTDDKISVLKKIEKIERNFAVAVSKNLVISMHGNFLIQPQTARDRTPLTERLVKLMQRAP